MHNLHWLKRFPQPLDSAFRVVPMRQQPDVYNSIIDFRIASVVSDRNLIPEPASLFVWSPLGENVKDLLKINIDSKSTATHSAPPEITIAVFLGDEVTGTNPAPAALPIRLLAKRPSQSSQGFQRACDPFGGARVSR